MGDERLTREDVEMLRALNAGMHRLAQHFVGKPDPDGLFMGAADIGIAATSLADRIETALSPRAAPPSGGDERAPDDEHSEDCEAETFDAVCVDCGSMTHYKVPYALLSSARSPQEGPRDDEYYCPSCACQSCYERSRERRRE